MSPADVNASNLKEALTEIADEQARLSAELAELTKFKRRLLQISLYIEANPDLGLRFRKFPLPSKRFLR